METTRQRASGMYNLTQVFIDRNVENGLGDKVAFIDPHRSLTYGQLQASSSKVANALVKAGVQRETRVAVLMLDTVDWPTVFFGAIKAGIIPVALNTLLVT